MCFPRCFAAFLFAFAFHSDAQKAPSGPPARVRTQILRPKCWLISTRFTVAALRLAREQTGATLQIRLGQQR
jgi:hypothetical protein